MWFSGGRLILGRTCLKEGPTTFSNWGNTLRLQLQTKRSISFSVTLLSHSGEGEERMFCNGRLPIVGYKTII